MSEKKDTKLFDLNKEFSFEQYTSEEGVTLPYRMYIPKDYDFGETYPLLVFMHGAGERGTDNTAQIGVGLPHLFDHEDSPAFESIIIAPQCPEEKQWVYTPWNIGNYSTDLVCESSELKCLVSLIENIASNYNVDKERIYLTGISMGGYATWDLLVRHSSVFAAGMPVCGGGDPSKSDILANIPIRIFHGALDGSVPVEASRGMYAAISGKGKNLVSYTEVENTGHNSWDYTYSDPENVKWLYSQKKTNEKGKIESSQSSFVRAGLIGAAVAAAGIFLLGRKSKKKRR